MKITEWKCTTREREVLAVVFMRCESSDCIFFRRSHSYLLPATKQGHIEGKVHPICRQVGQ